MDELKALEGRFNALTLKERVLLLSAAALALMFIANAMLLKPRSDRLRNLNTEIQLARSDIASLETQMAAAVARGSEDPDAATRRKIEVTTQAIAAADAVLAETTSGLIAPADMAQVLESVLKEVKGLTFVSIEGLGSEALLKTPDGEETDPGVGAFRHGIRIRFKGGYLDALAYLRALEALPWDFFWDSIDYVVGEYPAGDAAVVVYTLSRYQEWIGV